MEIFVDTSALYALLDAADNHHDSATRTFTAWLQDETVQFCCSNYVVVESIALVQNRLGMRATRLFLEELLPAITVHWIDEQIHQLAVTSILSANRRNLSVVDCSSFELARRRGIREVFAYDRHFAERGFRCRPGGDKD